MRKKVEFMLRLEEQQQQLAREAEILRSIREKAQREKEEEEERERNEQKEMAQYDNFYVITAKILGGGNMSLQKRLYSRPPHPTSRDGSEGDNGDPAGNSQKRPQSSLPRVFSAPSRTSSRQGSRQRLEKSTSAGTDTFQVPGQLDMSVLSQRNVCEGPRVNSEGEGQTSRSDSGKHLLDDFWSVSEGTIQVK